MSPDSGDSFDVFEVMSGMAADRKCNGTSERIAPTEHQYRQLSSSKDNDSPVAGIRLEDEGSEVPQDSKPADLFSSLTGPVSGLARDLSFMLVHLQNLGFELPWTCTVCTARNCSWYGACEECKSANQTYSAAIEALLAKITGNAGSIHAEFKHPVLEIALKYGPREVEGCLMLCQAMVCDDDPVAMSNFFSRAYRLWPALDSDLHADGVPVNLRAEADAVISANHQLQRFDGDGDTQEDVPDATEKMTPVLDDLQASKPGSCVAVVTMLGSLCPVTKAHVQAFIEARRLLLAEACTSRPAKLELFETVLGFLSLNDDEHVTEKLLAKQQPCLGFAGRKRCVEIATMPFQWLGWELREGCSLVRLRSRWPNLKFVHYLMGGADDILKYKKWRFARAHSRIIAMGRPGVTREMEAEVEKAGIDLDLGHFIIAAELSDLSSSQAREALVNHDTQLLAKNLDSNVARWCLQNWPMALIPATDWMDWFLGVSEMQLVRAGREQFFDQDCQAFIHARTGRRWPTGSFECPTIAELQHRVAALPLLNPKGVQPALVVAGDVDIGLLQAELETDDLAMVQVASNFNCLEASCRSHFPCSGNLVEGYALDATQGPAASFGTPAASLFRAHFAFRDSSRDPMTWGQTENQQIELLADVRNKFGTCINGKVTLTGAEVPVDTAEIAAVSANVRVGVHVDSQVVFGRSKHSSNFLCLMAEPLALVDQVFTASVNWQSLGVQPEPEQLERLTRVALRASYDGAYLAAILRGRHLLLLTLVGTGAFRNPREMVLEELAAAHVRWACHPASALREVRVCLYDADLDLAATVGDSLQHLLSDSGMAASVRWASAVVDSTFVQERRLVAKFLQAVAEDMELQCYGVEHTMHALETGAVETLLCWDALAVRRLHVRDPCTHQEQTLYITPESQIDGALTCDAKSDLCYDVLNDQRLFDWLVAYCKESGVSVQPITKRSHGSNTFCKGFDGIGALLKYPVQFQKVCHDSDSASTDSDSDFD